MIRKDQTPTNKYTNPKLPNGKPVAYSRERPSSNYGGVGSSF